MDIFDVLAMLGGLALFLYGMDMMGKGLERQAGNRLQAILEKLTANPAKGFLLGLATTAVIQSSSATTVMVVGFVNSGLMQLHQACGVIMGANVGTTVTAWILSLSGIEGESLLLRLLTPSAFSPVLALAGAVMYLFFRRDRVKNAGAILLGFAILMFGMETMSGAVEPLAGDPGFARLFTMFSNPILGVLTGAVLTAVIQSSSASVGILQALSATGAVTYASAIPIIMGQNIGTCVTALIASIGASRNAKRAAFIHLYFNILGVAIFLSLYALADVLFGLPLTAEPATELGIAVVHTCFNLLATAILLPFSRQLEKLACLTVRDGADDNSPSVALDVRLLNTPAVAVEQSRRVTVDMARTARKALNAALALVGRYESGGAEAIGKLEDRLDRYEDSIGAYLVKLSERELTAEDSRESALLLHMIGDFERIGDHAVNVVEAAQELHEKKIRFSDSAWRELRVLTNAVTDVLTMAVRAFETGDLALARQVEPLEQVVDELTREVKNRHVDRLQSGTCTIQQGFVLADLTNLCERVADHCANIAAALIEHAQGGFEMHGYTGRAAASADFQASFDAFQGKYRLPDA